MELLHLLPSWSFFSASPPPSPLRSAASVPVAIHKRVSLRLVSRRNCVSRRIRITQLGTLWRSRFSAPLESTVRARVEWQRCPVKPCDGQGQLKGGGCLSTGGHNGSIIKKPSGLTCFPGALPFSKRQIKHMKGTPPPHTHTHPICASIFGRAVAPNP